MLIIVGYRLGGPEDTKQEDEDVDAGPDSKAKSSRT